MQRVGGVRVRRDPSGRRSVVSGLDARRTAPFAFFMALVAMLMAANLTVWLWAVPAGVVAGLIAAMVGFRVVVDSEGVHLAKTWLAIPFRRRSFSLDVDVTHYDTLESPEVLGVVLHERRNPQPREDAFLFGTTRNATAIIIALKAEIEHVRAHLGPPTYRG